MNLIIRRFIGKLLIDSQFLISLKIDLVQENWDKKKHFKQFHWRMRRAFSTFYHDEINIRIESLIKYLKCSRSLFLLVDMCRKTRREIKNSLEMYSIVKNRPLKRRDWLQCKCTVLLIHTHALEWIYANECERMRRCAQTEKVFALIICIINIPCKNMTVSGRIT